MADPWVKVKVPPIRAVSVNVAGQAVTREAQHPKAVGGVQQQALEASIMNYTQLGCPVALD